jgi:iron complex transport system permease protein
MLLIIALLLFWLVNISIGSVSIPFKEILSGLFGNELSNDTWQHILFSFRIPKSITAILTGIGLSVVGLLMQTLFRNPMAGPSVLGISSGAGLGVALLVMGTGLLSRQTLDRFNFENNLGLSMLIAAIIGAFVVLLIILILSARIKNTLSILIIGLMLGALTTAIVGILSYFTKAEQLQQYMFWGFGSLGHLSNKQLWTYTILIFIGLISIILPHILVASILLSRDNKPSIKSI